VRFESPTRTAPAGDCLADLRSLLEASIARHDVPGAAVAVLHDGRLHEAAAGVINLGSGVPATPDTLFPFGSVSKVLTATIALRLVEQGEIDLDAPVRRYVPDFKPRDAVFGDAITVRHLLTHSSGLVGTIFRDTGWGEDSLARQVTLINGYPPFHRPGALLSYCNSGMVLLGRLIECVSGCNWHEAFRARFAEPLGLDSVVTRPEFALRFRTAVGHVRDPKTGQWAVEPQPFAFAGHAPAGSTPAGRARDLLVVARLYLDGGIGPDGTPYISAPLAAEALRPQIESPVSQLSAGWGLGWALYDWNGTRLIGHDGATIGTTAFLRVHPERRLAVALMTNVPLGLLVYEDVMGAIFQSLAGVWEPGIPARAPDFMPDPERYRATYEDFTYRLDLESEAGRLWLRAEPRSDNKLPTRRTGGTELHPYASDALYSVGDTSRALTDEGGRRTRLVRPYRIIEVDGEEFFHTGASAFRRVT
jgi:CubicO group peptidase (beta-lactamase class C family)